MPSGAANADDLYHRGRELLDLGEAAAAVDALARSVELEPHFKTLELLGEALVGLGRPKEAIVPLAAASTLHPGGRTPALLADVFLRLGRYEQADAMARLALQRFPEDELAREVRLAARRELPAER